ncbi:hypothetical protein WJX73_010907 [Symbiochloris irregularis]|uniref:Fungal lipase-type domain-containing protein n=1 Tax=Symbiochloris irregularis TaxID=706552 RepID=A0AAW1P2W8_9CHLO
MLGWEAILYFVCLNLCAALGISAVFAAFQEDLKWLMSSVAGTMHIMWGMQWHGYEAVKGLDASTSGYAIDSVWSICGNARAVVVAFRGADPYLQMDRRSDIPCGMVHAPGVGRVMGAFLRTLEQPFTSCQNGKRAEHAEHSIAGDLIRQLRKVAEQRQIYLTGHSLGAALAVLFGQLLCARQPELARQVAGVITFAGPRVGDSEFVDLMSHRLPNRIFRYEHASDIVPRLPQASGYMHGGRLRYITSFRWPGQASRMIREEDAPAYCKACYQNEERWAYPISLAKLIIGPFQETWPRVALRLTLLPLPGLSDHMPCDYDAFFRSRLPSGLEA